MEIINGTQSDEDFIPNTPETQKNVTRVFQNKKRSTKDICENRKASVKRKVGHPAKAGTKHTQMSISNFVTRLKRRKSFDNEISDKPNLENVISSLPYFSKCGKCMPANCTCQAQNIKKDNLIQCNDIVKDFGALKFNNQESIDGDVSLCAKPKENISSNDPEEELVHNNMVQDSHLSLSWMANVDWDNIDNEISFKSDCFPNPPKEDESVFYDEKLIVGSVVKHYTHHELEIILEDSSKMFNGKCILRGFWVDTIVTKGDEVRVLAPFINSVATIDDDSGFIIVNPDFLVSSTSIVSTLFCMRKAALSHKLRYWDSSNKIMMIGSFVHELFQQAVSTHYLSEVKLEDAINNILMQPENILSMYCQGISESSMKLELEPFISSITKWIKQYCSSDNGQTNDIQVNAVRDIEDNIWCPRYGIKGKIDLTLEVMTKSHAKLMPLELKTGASSFSAEHIGQVNLYTLMMEDRTGEESDGLLLYLRDQPAMKCIPSEHKTRRGLIQLRNEFVHFVHEAKRGEDVKCGSCFPEPLNNKRMCQKCSFLLPCTLYQKIDEDTKRSSTHAMSVLVPNATQHLTGDHISFFQHWNSLLNMDSAVPETKGFWNDQAEKREKIGLCFSNMVLKEDSPAQQAREGGLYVHKFFRSETSPVASSLLSVGIKNGEYIAISNQDKVLEIALAMGFVIHIEDNYVEISVERDIQKLGRYENYAFRIDKQNSARSTGSIGYSNLMKLMTSTHEATNLRELIIDRKEPSFQPTMSKSVAVSARPFVKSLNKLQRKAIFKALMANDYMLLKGMPGSGKTSTIVALVKLLLELDQRILLTSHTHSAVDNILLKLQEDRIDFLRLGQLTKIHKDLHSCSFEFLTENISSVGQLQDLVKSKRVIATTCLGVNNMIFQKLKFDICIVDESSQITLPDCLGPLFLSKKFILAGDPMQLPPVVVNQEAKSKGLEKSLFEYLEAPSNCMELVMQYRMNSEIMRLCNSLAYNNAMVCGCKEVETATLNINCLKLQLPTWLGLVLNKELKNSALFLDTDNVPALETQDDGQLVNNAESQLVYLLVFYLIKSGMVPCDIGVITPYRHQVELITKTLKTDYNGIEVNTVDQYQGRDKQVILMSCVRSKGESEDKKHTMSTIMDDMRRLTVAISRAKRKLIIVGSRSTLLSYKCFASLFEILHADQVVSLPKDAHEIVLSE